MLTLISLQCTIWNKVNEMERNRRWMFHENTFIPELVTFGFDDLKSAISLTEHSHPGCFEFVFIEKGRAAWEVGGYSYETMSGDVFTAFPDEVHKGNFDIIEPSRFWWIIVEARIGQPGGWLRLPACEEQAVLQALHGLPRVITIGSTASALFRRLQVAIQNGTDLDVTEGRSVILDFMLTLIRRNAPARGDRRTMQRLTSLIEQLPTRLNSSISVSDLAQEAGIGTTYFYRMFQEVTGLTPKAYIEHLRMEEASRRLIHTTESILNISMDLGFATSQHFATVFRRIKGRTPTEWRNRNAGT